MLLVGILIVVATRGRLGYGRYQRETGLTTTTVSS